MKKVNRLRQMIKTDGMMFRLMVFNFMIILFATVFITVAGNYIYANSLSQHAYASTAEIQNQVQKSVDFKVDAIGKSLLTLGDNECVQTYLAVDEDKEPQKRLEKEVEVRSLLLAYEKIYPDYLNIVMASENGQYLSNDSYRIQRTPLYQEDWYQEAVRAEGRPVIVGTSIGRNLKSWKNYSTDRYISIVQAVNETDTGKLIGVILVDWEISGIQNLVSEITLGQTGFVYVMDSGGKVLYSPENEIVHRINPKWFDEHPSGSVRCRILGSIHNLIYNQSEQTGLITVGVYDSSKAIEGVGQTRFASFLIAGGILILAAVWSIAFSASFTKPVKQLSKLMMRAQTGELTVHFGGNFKGEIGQLGNAFNSMVDKINDLLQLVYKEQKNKREAEMKMLQEQIKPHFLYNTLDTIQWMAKGYEAGDIVDIVLSLSQFFRISLSRGKEYISLGDEITMVKSYLDIQKYRYEEMFEYEADCPKELLSCKVVKLMLQPIVENALYHGIKESEEDYGTIWIDAQRESAETILIRVIDNGVGMSEERCRYVNEVIRQKERKSDVDFFGVLNVSDRIRMSFGEPYGLTYRPNPGGGTIVEIRTKAF